MRAGRPRADSATTLEPKHLSRLATAGQADRAAQPSGGATARAGRCRSVAPPSAHGCAAGAGIAGAGGLITGGFSTIWLVRVDANASGPTRTSGSAAARPPPGHGGRRPSSPATTCMPRWPPCSSGPAGRAAGAHRPEAGRWAHRPGPCRCGRLRGRYRHHACQLAECVTGQTAGCLEAFATLCSELAQHTARRPPAWPRGGPGGAVPGPGRRPARHSVHRGRSGVIQARRPLGAAASLTRNLGGPCARSALRAPQAPCAGSAAWLMGATRATVHTVAGNVSGWCDRQESNLRLSLRRAS